MCMITIELPDDVHKTLNLSPEDIAGELRLCAVIKLLELKRLSSGDAAKLAGVPRVAFWTKLSVYGVDTFDLAEENLLKETRLA